MQQAVDRFNSAWAISILALASLLCCSSGRAQEVYTVDISKSPAPPLSGHLQLGTHSNPAGHTMDANSLYFIRDGKPWYPVMGEFHFSRYPRKRWEESILQMKAAGIDVIATYVFWIYHEEKEGQFNWNDNKDLRYFAQLCKKHDIFLFVRIGPWCHGEVRNGGFPDWLVRRGNTRRNDPAYLSAVKDLYQATAGQLTGLYFKDGGPIIGAQIENEYRFNNAAGLDHILTLKRMAIATGIDVPFYTATAWQGANLTQDELVPVWGAYPEAPWDKRTTQLPLSENYLFSLLRNDPSIGNDLLGQRKEDEANYKGYRYPYATAEIGGGIQVTYHRRPIISSEDVTALAYTRIGSGANMIGYYMFHGGSDAIGQNSTLQESRATNCPNDYPMISYDFQAPIGEYGQLRPSYYAFKVLHSFLHHFGDRLAQYYPYFPDQKPSSPGDSTTLRFAVRAKGNSGFIFINNYQRQLQLESHDAVQIQLRTADNHTISVFDKPTAIPSGLQAILPFNMNLHGANLISATVQPLSILDGAIPTYIFFQPEGLTPGYVFENTGIQSLTVSQATVHETEGKYVVTSLHPGTDCLVTVKLANGQSIRILTLTQQQALDSWQGKALGEERFMISPQSITFDQGTAHIQSTDDVSFDVSVLPAIRKLKGPVTETIKPQRNGIFSRFTWQLPSHQDTIRTDEISDITPFENKGAQLPSDDRNDKNTPGRPGPQYQTNLQPVKGARYWRVHVPLLKSPALLITDYSGDTGAAYAEGRLFSDDFYFGRNWSNALPEGSSARDLIIQIVPFTPERDVYLEKNVKEGIEKDMTPILRSVRLLEWHTVEL